MNRTHWPIGTYRFNTIQKHAKRRRNMTYAHLPTKYQQERHRKGMFRLITVMFLILATNFIWTNISPMAYRSFTIVNEGVVREHEIDSGTATPVESTRAVLVEITSTSPVEKYIEQEAIEHNIKVSTALRIAKCESTFNPKAKNPKGTASGVYQFINQTWTNYCLGDVFNYRDNIDCFMDHFNQHPQWWQESLDIEGIKIKSK